MAITKTLWGTHNGIAVYLITIAVGGMRLSVTNFGCTIVSIQLADRNGNSDNMILGYDSLKGYVGDSFYMGSLVGRFANRIANATFNIGETSHVLAANDLPGGNHLHGGNEGFNKKVFSQQPSFAGQDDNSVTFYYKSVDGEEGYPGNLDVYITYALTEDQEVIIKYKARTDQATPVNLTSHCYFNLSGEPTSATGHRLFLHADEVLAADRYYIPTGKTRHVKTTDRDFTISRPIDPGQGEWNGYNDCYVLLEPGKIEDVKATLMDPVSGRRMQVKTTLPGIMFYTGDYLNAPFQKCQGVCLEAQFFPDSPNQPSFPDTILHPGKVYEHQTIYQFK